METESRLFFHAWKLSRVKVVLYQRVTILASSPLTPLPEYWARGAKSGPRTVLWNTGEARVKNEI